MRVLRNCRRLILIALFSSVLSLWFYYNIPATFSAEKFDQEYKSEEIRPPTGGSNGTEPPPPTDCFNLSPEADILFSNCRSKLKWLKEHWREEECFAGHGVTEEECSQRIYLSEVEQHCPPLREVKSEEFEKPPSLEALFGLFNDTQANYVFIKQRITKLWPAWVEALQKAKALHPRQFENYRRKTIFVHLGFLMSETKINIVTQSSSGGPLGELVQWSDLLAALHILGHKLYITTQKFSLKKNIDAFKASPSCPGDGHLDLIITDIMGFIRGFRKEKEFASKHKCKLRLVDSFGTHAEFNTRSYFLNHKTEFGGKKNPWGGHSLKLQQYWTFYPHTSDNSFLGFVVQSDESVPMFDRKSRKAVLIYGKMQYMWKGFGDVMETLKKNGYEIHATVADAGPGNPLFEGVVNHGFLAQSNISSLLKSVGAFIGLGFPLEGPAPLEAVANGAVFINAQFNPPQSRMNTPFLAEKPTLRLWSSQCPHMEKVGSPYSYTVDVHKEEELLKALGKAFSIGAEPHIPEEFSPLGMLLRVNNMVLNQDFCSAVPRYPSRKELKTFCGWGSCDQVCQKEELLCEPSFFHFVNTEEELRKCSSNCTAPSPTQSVFAPFNCSLQSNDLLFSCASVPPPNSTRVCPCRRDLPY